MFSAFLTLVDYLTITESRAERVGLSSTVTSPSVRVLPSFLRMACSAVERDASSL